MRLSACARVLAHVVSVGEDHAKRGIRRIASWIFSSLKPGEDTSRLRALKPATPSTGVRDQSFEREKYSATEPGRRFMTEPCHTLRTELRNREAGTTRSLSTRKSASSTV